MNGAKAEKSPLDIALEGKSEDFKRKVLEIVHLAQLPPDDPTFLLLISTGRLEVLLDEAPRALDALFKHWTTDIRQTFELVNHAFKEKQMLAIAEAARDLISMAERKEQTRFFGSLLPAVGIFLAVLGLGFAIGHLVGYADFTRATGGYVDKEVKLTLDEAESLRWAQSSEGKFARNLMKWNRGYLDNRACLADAKRLNVRLLLDGRPVKEGFCTIWTVPPEQRKYE